MDKTLLSVVADARAGCITDDRIETFWGREYAFRSTDDGRLKVWEWYSDDTDGPERGLLTTFTLEGYTDEAVVKSIVSEYEWRA